MHKKEGDKEQGDEFVKWFSELSNKDIGIAGGKGASLAEMYNNNFPIPPGFIITAQAYDYFIEKAGIKEKIKESLEGIDVEDTKGLNEVSKKIRSLFHMAEMPVEMKGAIIEAYNILDVDEKSLEHARQHALEILKHSREPAFVAIRSSATTEDLSDASFAGQQESFLNVKGNAQLIDKVKACFSSLFTPRAIYYRIRKGFGNEKAQLAVVVQKMIDSDKSGVVFSQDPVSKDKTIVIEAVWGLGEGIVSGMIQPDYYKVDSDLNDFKILETKVAKKKSAVTRNASGRNEIVKLSDERARRQVLSNYEIKMLAQYAKKLEEHYKKPQDVEFAISGRNVYIVQSRPITTIYSGGGKELSGEVLVSGLGASPGTASGVVKIIHSLDELSKIKKGDVLVTIMTNPDMVVSMQKATAIVTDEGGITSHASIVSREMGIPCVVGTENATSVLEEGQTVTVDGYNGKVYAGKGEAKAVEIKPVVPTKTEIKVIVDIPSFAERAAKTGIKAIGLVRLEGIIASSGKHPLFFVKNRNIKEYTDLIYSGLKKIAEHFDDVWIRTSDLRSDEFMHLEGAPRTVEGNPMLGDHGARFSLRHKEIMEAEISAIKMLADNFKHKKFGIMVPQIISVEEVRATKETAKKLNVPKNAEIGIMVETPAAVQIINELCEEGISFISFGTNDLTQYMLAIDRNNEAVQYLYNEMNPAVLSALSYVIRKCRKYGVKTSICGQAGSKEDMVRFLMKEGIDSISCNADAAEKVSKIVAQIEQEKGYGKRTSDGEKHMQDEKMMDNEHSPTPLIRPSIPLMKQSSDDDIEDVLLKELDENGDEYMPGDSQHEQEKKDIPPLNDAIPIDSEMLKEKADENDKVEEVELDK